MSEFRDEGTSVKGEEVDSGAETRSGMSEMNLTPVSSPVWTGPASRLLPGARTSGDTSCRAAITCTGRERTGPTTGEKKEKHKSRCLGM